MNAFSANILSDGDDEFRAAHVGASEVAALFGESPYLTAFELFHRKKGNISTPDFGGDERIEAGIRMEPAILQWAFDRYGYTDREQLPRLDNGKGLGGHPDRRVICPERGPGILEIKTADWLVRKSWGDEPPMHYLIQSQAYQGLDHVAWGDVLVLVGGNKLDRFQYEFRPKIYAEIEQRVTAFWQSVREGKAPPAVEPRDLGVLAELYPQSTGEVIDLQGDNLAAHAAAVFLAEDEKAKAATAARDAAKAELIDKLGAASFATLDGFTLRATDVAAIPERTAEPGEIISGRKAYRRFTVKETV